MNRRLGGADETHDLAVLELRMVAHQPEDGPRPVVPPRTTRIATTLGPALGFRQAHFAGRQLEPVARIRLAPGDLLARELAGLDRVEPLDALGSVPVRHGAHLERVQLAKIGD